MRIIFLCLALTLTNIANSAILNVSAGQLIGAQNIEVLGSFYDVTFQDGAFDDLYSSGIPTYHDTYHEAQEFTVALLNQVFIDSIQGNFDTETSLTNGCSDTSLCYTYTPHAVNLAGNVQLSGFLNRSLNGLDQEYADVISSSRNTVLDANKVYAVFTPTQVTAVPEPSSYIMFILGLFFLFYMRRTN